MVDRGERERALQQLAAYIVGARRESIGHRVYVENDFLFGGDEVELGSSTKSRSFIMIGSSRDRIR